MFSGLEMPVNCDNVRTVLNTSLSVSVFRNDEFLCVLLYIWLSCNAA